MTHRRVAFLSCLLAGFAVGTVTAVAQDTPGRAVVRLAPGADGQCDAVEKTEDVRVSKSKQPFVTFVVTNDCADAVVFSVDGFRHPSRGRGVDPMQQAAGQRRLRVREGRGPATLRLRVKSDAPEGEWTYDIKIDDRVVDPKLHIDP